jgi:hypothetical protein
MKKYLLLVLLNCLALNLFAQDVLPHMDTQATVARDTTYWNSEFSAGLNFNQASFSGNWKAGGVSSIAFGTLIFGKANYAKEKWSWDNQLELVYGIVKNQGQTFRKSNDRIFFDSKLGYEFAPKWSYFTSVNFITQFDQGFDYGGLEPVLISGFFSPAFLTTGLGIQYKPNEEFALRMAPFSPRFTVVSNPDLFLTVPENFGVPIGSTVRTEWLAFQLFMTYNKKISENLTFNSRYQLFANYEQLSFRNVDHRLDFTVIAKITRFVDVTFTSINVYDLDMSDKIQYSQGLALGILYKVSNKK